MTVYAHRGNMRGPVPHEENKPDYVQLALDAGLHAEVDLRIIGGNCMLGHDFPAYWVSLDWLADRADKLLIHAKDIPTALFLARNERWHWFSHSNDACTLTSKGFVWLHALAGYSKESSGCTIVPLLTSALLDNPFFDGVQHICSDYTPGLRFSKA